MISSVLIFTSCEQKEPVLEEIVENELFFPDFTLMSQNELIAYFENVDLSSLRPAYAKTWTDTLNAEEFLESRKSVPTRSSYDCEIFLKPYLNPPLDSIDITVYLANTTTVYRDKERVGDRQVVPMMINGADYYDFKLQHPDDSTGNISGYLEIDPVWGGISIYFFPIWPGPHTFIDYNFECLEPTNGICDAYVNVYKRSGSASEYGILIFENGIPLMTISGLTGDISQRLPFTCDETKSYDFYVYCENGSASETFDVNIIRPDYVSHAYNMINMDMSDRSYKFVIGNFDYFKCP